MPLNCNSEGCHALQHVHQVNSIWFPPSPPSVCSAGTITVHLQKDSRGHLSLVATPLKENRGPFKVSTESAAVAIWQTLQQTTGSSGGAHPLVQWQLAHSLEER